MQVKDTFLSKYPDIDNRHVYVVIFAHQRWYIMVNFTSRRPPCDDSCIVRPGEHSFVTADTIVEYRRLLEFGEMTAALIDPGRVTRRYEPVSDELLRRIREGAVKSKFTPRRAKGIIQAALEG